MSPSPVAALWRLRPYLRPYRRQLIVMVLASVAVEGAEIAIPLVIKSLIDGAITHHDRGLLLPLGFAVIGLGATAAALGFIRRWIQGSAVAGVEMTMRGDLYRHLQQLDPAFHDRWQSGQLLSRATTDLSAIRRFAGFGLVFLFISTFTFALVVGLLISLNWWLGLTTGLLFAPLLVFCTIFERRYTLLARRAQDQDGDLTTLVEEASTGVRILKSLGRAPEASGRFMTQAGALGRTRIDMASLLGRFWSTLDMVPNAVIAVAVVFGALAVSHHGLTIGGLVAFITLALQLVWPVEALGYVLASGEEAATAAQRVLEIFDTKPAISDPTLAAAGQQEPADQSERVRPAATGPHVLFDQVAFVYPGNPAPVLREVSLEVRRGETLVITGATGSGKTTLLNLVPRLADVSSGRVLVNGADVRDIPLAELRAAVGCAFEEATLFSASVRENVTFGAPDATEEQVEAALTAAQARFAYDLPWGLDTRIGEQGMSLSGGQRQRVALARAILTRPEVLILDDPLSALDVATEERVTRALGEILTGVTALVVAHRPSTVALADRVALLSGGVITAVGSHHDLMTEVPAYADLMTMEEVTQ